MGYINWADEFMQLFGKDVPMEFRLDRDDTRLRWSRGVYHISAVNNEFLIDALRWWKVNHRGNQSGEFTCNELELMVWEYI